MEDVEVISNIEGVNKIYLQNNDITELYDADHNFFNKTINKDEFDILKEYPSYDFARKEITFEMMGAVDHKEVYEYYKAL